MKVNDIFKDSPLDFDAFRNTLRAFKHHEDVLWAQILKFEEQHYIQLRNGHKSGSDKIHFRTLSDDGVKRDWTVKLQSGPEMEKKIVRVVNKLDELFDEHVAYVHGNREVAVGSK